MNTRVASSVLVLLAFAMLSPSLRGDDDGDAALQKAKSDHEAMQRAEEARKADHEAMQRAEEARKVREWNKRQVRIMEERLESGYLLDVSPREITLGEALKRIGEAYGLNFKINSAEFEKIGVADVESRSLKLPRMMGASLRTILYFMLAEIRGTDGSSGTFIVHPDHIEVTTTKHAGPFMWEATPRGRRSVLKMKERLATLYGFDRALDPKTAFRDALEFMADRYDFPFIIQQGAFDKVGWQPFEDAVDMPAIREVPMETMLRLLLWQVANGEYHLDCIVRAEFIEIVPAPRTEANITFLKAQLEDPAFYVEKKARPLNSYLPLHLLMGKEIEVRHYPARKAAHQILKKWKVEVPEPVVEEVVRGAWEWLLVPFAAGVGLLVLTATWVRIRKRRRPAI